MSKRNIVGKTVAKKKRNTHGNHSEYAEQCEFVDYVRSKGVMCHGNLNGARLERHQRIHFLRAGMCVGLPDVFVMHKSRNGVFAGLFIEMKRANGGRATVAQKEVIDHLNKHGYYAIVCHGASKAIAVFDAYMYQHEFLWQNQGLVYDLKNGRLPLAD